MAEKKTRASAATAPKARSTKADRERIQGALLRIAEAAAIAHDMPEFYRTIHAIVGELMYADNFYIALYEAATGRMSFPFYVDEVDQDIPDPNEWWDVGTEHAAGVTGYVLRLGEPQLQTLADWRRLLEEGAFAESGLPAVTWVGVPLQSEGRTVGLVATQSYDETRKHTKRDLAILTSVGAQIGAALERTRAIEETRQRNAELAIVNEIGTALAEQLDFRAIIELVGERLHRIFESKARDLYISSYDRASGVITFPYWLNAGRRLDVDPVRHGESITTVVLDSRRALRLATHDEVVAAGAIFPVGTESGESWLGVPILAGDVAIGTVTLYDPKRHAFSESDERIVSTIAASMGVALENARLFDATRQQNAELAIVNEIGAALAKQLDFEAIVELVGARISAIFSAHSMFIALYDPATRLISFPYSIEEHEPAPFEPLELGVGLTSIVIESGQPQLLTSFEQMVELGAVPDGVDAESWLGVPILGRRPGPRSDRPREPRAQRLFPERCQAPLDARLEHGRSARECPAVRRDEAAPRRDGPARGRACRHQHRPAGSGGRHSTCRRCTTSSARRSARSSRLARSGSPSRTRWRGRSASPIRSPRVCRSKSRDCRSDRG